MQELKCSQCVSSRQIARHCVFVAERLHVDSHITSPLTTLLIKKVTKQTNLGHGADKTITANCRCIWPQKTLILFGSNHAVNEHLKGGSCFFVRVRVRFRVFVGILSRPSTFSSSTSTQTGDTSYSLCTCIITMKTWVLCIYEYTLCIIQCGESVYQRCMSPVLYACEGVSGFFWKFLAFFASLKVTL